MIGKFVGSGKTIDFSWDNPAKAFVLTGLTLLLITYALAWILRFSGVGVMWWNTTSMYKDINSAMMDAADGDVELAQEVTQQQWPSACDIDKKGKFKSKACDNALKNQANGDVIFAAVQNLEDLGLTWEEVSDAYNEYDDDSADGWSSFTGGDKLQNQVGRPGSLNRANNQANSEDPGDFLDINTLKSLANGAVTHGDKKSDAAKDFYDVLKDHPQEKVSEILNKLIRYFVLFIVFGCLMRVFQASSGRARTGWGFVLILLALVLVEQTGKKAALGALDLGSADGSVFETLLGPVLAVLSQVLVFVKRVVSIAGDGDTKSLLEPLFLAGILLLIVSWKSKWSLPVGAYLLLVQSTWLDALTSSGKSFNFSPFDLDAFDASFVLPPMVWLLEVVAIVAALYLLVGAWRHLGEPIIDKCSALCGCADATDTKVDSAPAAPPRPPSAG